MSSRACPAAGICSRRACSGDAMDGIGGRRYDRPMKYSRVGSIALALISLAGVASAQDWKSWPDKPVHIVVPLTAGSATDVMARLVAKRLSEQLGQSFIVENKPGAGGTIGMGAVARARPDGYTLLVQSSSYTITPITYPNTPYDVQRDLAGVTPLAPLPPAPG